MSTGQISGPRSSRSSASTSRSSASSHRQQQQQQQQQPQPLRLRQAQAVPRSLLQHHQQQQQQQQQQSHHQYLSPPPSSLTPENKDLFALLDPCAATGSFFLYAQRNVILVLHHDTLAIERRFELHHEDVLWIAVDNVSERGAGRLAVSYDIGHTAIVWDILTGAEVARFAAYDQINVATFMRNGNIAFGNTKGSIILFEPSTSEHINKRTIFDPITALAPCTDCTTFAIGYLNGSILIATLQPAFTILHTLNTSRGPSKIMGLSWHGASSKAKTDMLATQTLDGDMRVWSVPKVGPDPPNVIRVLSRSDYGVPGPCWFAWSKTGRIVQFADGETRAWDVRTKKVTYDVIPTVDGVAGIAIYGPGATLFTLGRNHTVQQYDIHPTAAPIQVCSVQHVPANTPPTPPTLLEERKKPYASAKVFDSNAPMLPTLTDTDSSADDGAALSPLQKIAKEMDSLDQLESELRDKVTPLSPTSSRASSSASSRSSAGARRQRKYLYDRPESSRASVSTGADETEFSFGGMSQPVGRERDSLSIQSVSTRASHRRRPSSGLRKEVLRSPQELPEEKGARLELFPFLKHRARDVPFRTPHYGEMERTAELLQREMLSTVFGWNGDIESLIREEMSKHSPGSTNNVLLSKWLGDVDPDVLSSTMGSQSMSSSDWMLLALSAIGQDSQKVVGEAFVQRLLEKGEVHPAVAILLGLGEHNDAIEVYVSQEFYMEAVLLTCLLCPHDWGRQAHLLRKWGENAVKSGSPELAVRCFSCCTQVSTDSWRSPKTQDAMFAAQQEHFMQTLSADAVASPPISPPSRSGSGRIAAKNPSLKLITTFGDKGAALHRPGGHTPLAAGVTPIAESALSPGGINWQPHVRSTRDPSTARTATPGEYTARKRMPSRSDIERAKRDAAEIATPMTTLRDVPAKSTSNALHGRRTPSVSGSESVAEPTTALPTSRVRRRDLSRDRGASPLPRGIDLQIKVVDSRLSSAELTPAPTTHDLESIYSTIGVQPVKPSEPSPRTLKAQAIDDYIQGVETARQERAQSRQRGESRRRQRDGSRRRDTSTSRPLDEKDYIRPAKKSPSSPVSMSPEEIAQASQGKDNGTGTGDAEDFYKLTSPTGSSRNTGLAPVGRTRGNSSSAVLRSPLSPVPLTADTTVYPPPRARSSSRKPDDLQTRRAASRNADRDRSTSRRPSARTQEVTEHQQQLDEESKPQRQQLQQPVERQPRTMSRKELAARELEERRLSLARRPSAPPIPLPGELAGRPIMGPRHHSDVSDISTAHGVFGRSQTVDPGNMSKYNKTTGQSTPSVPIGLPATPRAMRHPRYMREDPDKDDAPPVPHIPGNFTDLSSNLSATDSSQLSQSTQGTSGVEMSARDDDLGPLLPSTVFGQVISQPPTRSASVPLELSAHTFQPHPAYNRNIPSSHRGNHAAKNMATDASATGRGIDHTIHGGEEVTVIMPEEMDSAPPILPELQHLAGPPPPPPPPMMYLGAPQGIGSGLINIAIDEEGPSVGVIDVPVSLPQPMERVTGTDRAATASPTAQHRRGRGSMSETIGSRIRGFGVRASSRTGNRVKSPATVSTVPAPYETVLSGITSVTGSTLSSSNGGGSAIADRAKSPYELAISPSTSRHQQQQHQQQSLHQQSIILDPNISDPAVSLPTPPPPPPTPPRRAQSTTAVYRNPKEIRANMPPETLQQGVYKPMQGGFL